MRFLLWKTAIDPTTAGEIDFEWEGDVTTGDSGFRTACRCAAIARGRAVLKRGGRARSFIGRTETGGSASYPRLLRGPSLGVEPVIELLCSSPEFFAARREFLVKFVFGGNPSSCKIESNAKNTGQQEQNCNAHTRPTIMDADHD
jgi:hypothetical protein